jgi:hypothetical protein
MCKEESKGVESRQAVKVGKKNRVERRKERTRKKSVTGRTLSTRGVFRREFAGTMHNAEACVLFCSGGGGGSCSRD